MERTAVLRTLADALSSSPPGDLDDHVVDDLCALFGGDAPLVVEAILRRHPQCRKRKNILSENVRRCAEAAYKSGVPRRRSGCPPTSRGAAALLSEGSGPRRGPCRGAAAGRRED